MCPFLPKYPIRNCSTSSAVVAAKAATSFKCALMLSIMCTKIHIKRLVPQNGEIYAYICVMPLNYIDLAVVCLLVYGLVRGAYRGFFVEVSSLLALVLGVFGALHFSNFTASLLANYIDGITCRLLGLLSLTFYLVIIIGVVWIGKLLTKLAKVVLLGFLTRLLGALFGACKWLVICGVLVWILGQIDVFFSFLPETLKDNSLVFEPLEELGAYLFKKINTEEIPINNIPLII